MIFGLRLTRDGAHLRAGDLSILVLPRALALRTWVGHFPSMDTTPAFDVPFVTDAYLLAGTGQTGARRFADIDYLPGQHVLKLVLPKALTAVQIDGEASAFEFDALRNTASLSITVPEVPASPIDIADLKTWVERVDPVRRKWLKGSGKSLEQIGVLPFGFVKYLTTLTWDGRSRIYLKSFGINEKKVFLNGELLSEWSHQDRYIDLSSANRLRPGVNHLTVIYEQFGSNEFGETARLLELNGVDSLQIIGGSSSVEAWKIQTHPLPVKGRDLDPAFTFPGTPFKAFDGESGAPALLPAFTWIQARFTLPTVGSGWTIPWRLHIASDRDAVLYFNGRILGRYSALGPQSAFVLPETELRSAGQENLVTLVLGYTDTAAGLSSLRVEPYADYAVKRSRIAFTP